MPACQGKDARGTVRLCIKGKAGAFPEPDISSRTQRHVCFIRNVRSNILEVDEIDEARNSSLATRWRTYFVNVNGPGQLA